MLPVMIWLTIYYKFRHLLFSSFGTLFPLSRIYISQIHRFLPCFKINVFELKILDALNTRRSKQSILRRSVLGVHWKDWYGSWNSNPLATWCEELTHLKRPWCWERLKAGGEGDNRGWDSWMASPTWWIWVWVDSGSWWWTGRPGMLRFMGSRRVGHNWVTELNWTQQGKLTWDHLSSSIFSCPFCWVLYHAYFDNGPPFFFTFHMVIML